MTESLAPRLVEVERAFDASLERARRQLSVLHAANSVGDHDTSGCAACEVRAAFHAASTMSEQALAERSGRAAELAKRLVSAREEARYALELAFTPSPAAIREATAGTSRALWDREVAAWRAARGHIEPPHAEPAVRLPSLMLVADSRRASSKQPAPSKQRTTSGPIFEQQLPGWMMIVTLLDASGGLLTTRTEPLHGDAPRGAFFGRVNGNRIDWKQGVTTGEVVVEMSPRLGVQYDAKGRVTNPGISIEQWLAVAGKGRARTVLIEIEPARIFQHDKSGREGGADRRPDKRALHPVGTGAAGTARSTVDGTTDVGLTTRLDSGGTATDGAPVGHTDQPSRDAKYPGADVVGKPGGAEKGPAHGKVGGHQQGSTQGKRDGTKSKAGYLEDPAAPGRGTNAVTTDGSTPDGMVGGRGKKGDQGTPASSGLLPLISLPRKIAPAVTLGMILLDADLANWADEVVKISSKLGKAAAGKGGALSKLIAGKFDRYVDRELAQIAESLAREGQFIAKTADEQAEILRQIREAIEIEAHAKLSAKLDQKVAEGERWAKQAAAEQNRFTEDTIRDSLEYADAARRARDALPPKSPSSRPQVATHETPQASLGEPDPPGSSTTGSKAPEPAAKPTDKHPQEPAKSSKNPAQASEHVGRVDAKQRIWVRVDELTIEDTLTSQEWIFYIEAPLPNGRRQLIAGGSVLLDANQCPIGGPTFALYKDVVIDGNKMRVSVGTPNAPVSLTDLALEESSKMYKLRFRHQPTELPGALVDDNRRIFQAEYLKAIDGGASHEAAELAAIRETPFGKARIRRGYTEITVDTMREPWEVIQHGTPPKPRKVPRKIEATARRPR